MNKRIAFKVMHKAQDVGLLNYKNRKRLRSAFKVYVKYNDLH